MSERLSRAIADLFSGTLNRKQRAAVLDLLEVAEGIGRTEEIHWTFKLWPERMQENFAALKSLKQSLRQ